MLSDLLKLLKTLVATLWNWTVFIAIAGIDGFEKAKTAWLRLAHAVTHGAVSAAVPAISDLAKTLPDIVKQTQSILTPLASPLVDSLKDSMAVVAKSGFDKVSSGLLAKTKAGPEDWEANAAEAVGDAFGFGLASFLTSTAFEECLPKDANSLNGLGSILATMAGLEEVTGAALGPLFEATITRGARYSFNRKLRNLFPVPQAGAELYARRLITQVQLKNLFALAGLHPDFEDATVKAAFRPVRPMALASLGDDLNFDWNKLRDAMRFSGNREADIDLMVLAFQEKALKSYKSAARAAVLANYEAGIVADLDLASDLDAIDQATDQRTLVHMTALDKRLLAITKDYLADWDAQVEAGEISIVQYQTALHGLGIVDPVLSALVAKAEGKISARGFRQELAAQTLAAHRTQLLAVQAAMTGYKNRKLDEKQLVAALLAAGVGAAQAALYLELAKARGQKKLPKSTTKA